VDSGHPWINKREYFGNYVFVLAEAFFTTSKKLADSGLSFVFGTN